MITHQNAQSQKLARVVVLGAHGFIGTAIRRQIEAQGIPVIALTAHALEQDRVKAMEAGADDYDTKPINLSRLIEKIESHLPS